MSPPSDLMMVGECPDKNSAEKGDEFNDDTNMTSTDLMAMVGGEQESEVVVRYADNLESDSERVVTTLTAVVSPGKSYGSKTDVDGVCVCVCKHDMLHFCGIPVCVCVCVCVHHKQARVDR